MWNLSTNGGLVRWEKSPNKWWLKKIHGAHEEFLWWFKILRYGPENRVPQNHIVIHSLSMFIQGKKFNMVYHSLSHGASFSRFSLAIVLGTRSDHPFSAATLWPLSHVRIKDPMGLPTHRWRFVFHGKSIIYTCIYIYMQIGWWLGVSPF